MTKILFPRDWIKLSPSKKSRIQDDKEALDRKISGLKENITVLERERETLQIILDVDNKRGLIAQYWDSVSPDDRKNFGKSKDEIENGSDAKSISPITYENVGQYSWSELDEFWQGSFLAGLSGYSIDELMTLIQKQPLTV